MKRSKWKGLFTKPEIFNTNNKSNSKKISRNSSIIPKFVDQTFKVHNGKAYKEITVTKDMLGFKFGEFFKTRIEFEFKKKKKKKKK